LRGPEPICQAVSLEAFMESSMMPAMNDATRQTRPTKGVEILQGDPKVAIRRLALPTVVAMSAQIIYNLADAYWVAGLGSDALAAVGLFFPFFFVAMALATGVGVGGGSAVSRFVGAKDREGAGLVATHTFVIMVVAAVAFIAPMLAFTRPIFAGFSSGHTLELTVDYARIMFGGSFVLFFSHVALSLLRGEGDVKRPMVAMMAGSVLNIVLDPLFIFDSLGPMPGLGLGVAGAAWASLLSMLVTAFLLFYWLFFRKNTWISLRFRGFRFRRDVLKDILRVGLPSSVQHTAMAVMMMLLNAMLVLVGGTDAVAVFTTGWRVIMIATLPVMGLTTALVAVSGAATGMGDPDRLDKAYMYAIKLGVSLEILSLVALQWLAEPIAAFFTSSPESLQIRPDLVVFLSTVSFFLPAVPLGMCTSGLFQGAGRGSYALIVTLIRTLLLAVPAVYMIGVLWFGDMQGICLGLVVANLTGGSIGFIWARLFIRGLKTDAARVDKLPE